MFSFHISKQFFYFIFATKNGIPKQI